ncbi:helix-turn-helix domain-containing protein [Raoultella sp. WB_B2P2-3]|uniref:helix-turn-helix domain-containing protein n=1 Tax=Raoultella scottii TaxID=3040937 RepID=UPI002F94E1A0
MAKTLAQIQAKHEHKSKDKDGKIVTSQKFIKNFTFFEDIEYLYSKNCPNGIKIDGWHVALYCRFLSYQANGNNCYESHETLARKCKASSSTVKRRIEDLRKLGLVVTVKHPDLKISSLLYTALPLTDAHVIPPDQLSAAPESDVVRQQPEPMPAPEPATAEELNVPDLDDVPCVRDEPDYQATPSVQPTAKPSKKDIMDAACRLLIENIDNQPETECFMTFAQRIFKNLRKKLPEGIEEYFKKNHSEYFDIIEDIKF